jgi:hypothetical protein
MKTEGSLSRSQEPAAIPQLTRCVQLNPKPQFRKGHIDVTLHLRLALKRDFFRLGFPTNILSALFISPMLPTFPAFPIPLILSTFLFLAKRNYEAPHSTLLTILVTSSILGPNILFSTLFSHALNLCSCFNVRD